jgi:hypothetical protein
LGAVVRCAGGDCNGARVGFAEARATAHTLTLRGGLEQERCIEHELEV